MTYAARFSPSKTARDIVRILAWVPVGIFFTKHCYSLATVTGASMQPTFNPDLAKDPSAYDHVLLEKWSVALNRYKRGEVITLWSPQNPTLLTTKRIIALEDDVVTPLPPSAPTPIRIPPGHCWVEGDAKRETLDSNTYGPVPLGLVNAKVRYVLWPPSHAGSINNGAGKSDGRVRRFRSSTVA